MSTRRCASIEGDRDLRLSRGSEPEGCGQPWDRARHRHFGGHHITLRLSDPDRSRHFYEGVLGLQLDRALPGKYHFRLGLGAECTRLVLHAPLPGTPSGDRFSEYLIGLDRVALTVHEPSELGGLVTMLRKAGVATQGIQAVPGGGLLVCFRDPDNVRWELFSNGSVDAEHEVSSSLRRAGQAKTARTGR
jgi:catechol 2,3-dioxygenase-like lactoylglutathione lyase family enzyme